MSLTRENGEIRSSVIDEGFFLKYLPKIQQSNNELGVIWKSSSSFGECEV